MKIIEMIRSINACDFDCMQEILENLDQLLVDYVVNSHLPDHDKLLIKGAWIVMNQSKISCGSCKDTGSLLSGSTIRLSSQCRECNQEGYWSSIEKGLFESKVHGRSWSDRDAPDGEMLHVWEMRNFVLDFLDVDTDGECDCSLCNPLNRWY